MIDTSDFETGPLRVFDSMEPRETRGNAGKSERMGPVNSRPSARQICSLSRCL